MIKLSTGLRNALAGGPGFGPALTGGTINIYSGPQPLTADSAASGTLLGTVTKDGGPFTAGSPANGLTFSVAALGVLAKSGDNWKFTGLAAGTAGWFRFTGNPIDNGASSATLPRMDGTCGTAGSGDCALSSISVVVGSPHTIDVFSFEIPAQ